MDDAAGPIVVELAPNENDANGLGFAGAAVVSDDFGVSELAFWPSTVDLIIGDEIGVDDAGFVMPLPKIIFCSWAVGVDDDEITEIGGVAVGAPNNDGLLFGDDMVDFSFCNAATMLGFENAAPNEIVVAGIVVPVVVAAAAAAAAATAGLFLMCCGGIVTLKFTLGDVVNVLRLCGTGSELVMTTFTGGFFSTGAFLIRGFHCFDCAGDV